MRAFIALPIPEQTRREALALAERLRKGLTFGGPGISWSRPEQYHLTLKFLGDDVPDTPEFLAKAKARLEATLTGAQPVKAEWGRAEALPSVKSPKSIFLGMGRAAERRLAELASRAERAMEPLGFEREEREYKAHLTLGRVKSMRGAHVLADTLQNHSRFRPDPSELKHVVFYKSDVSDEGREHRELFRVELVARTS
jgi:2'-5' RNA ligase